MFVARVLHTLAIELSVHHYEFDVVHEVERILQQAVHDVGSLHPSFDRYRVQHERDVVSHNLDGCPLIVHFTVFVAENPVFRDVVVLVALDFARPRVAFRDVDGGTEFADEFGVVASASDEHPISFVEHRARLLGGEFPYLITVIRCTWCAVALGVDVE